MCTGIFTNYMYFTSLSCKWKSEILKIYPYPHIHISCQLHKHCSELCLKTYHEKPFINSLLLGREREREREMSPQHSKVLASLHIMDNHIHVHVIYSEMYMMYSRLSLIWMGP